MLLIKYATRGRPELFRKAIQNILDTVSTKDYKIIISADSDDELLNSIDNQIEDSGLSKIIEVNFSNQISKVHAINRDLEGVKFDWLVNMSDDMHFTVKGWDELMLKQIRKRWKGQTDFFAHFNDGFVGEKLPTMSIMGWDYYQRDGYIYHPSYNSVSCDAEAMFVAMMRGKRHYFPDVYFNHLHPANIRTMTDATYQGNHKFDKPDTENYFKRMARGFDVKNPVMIPDEVKRYMNEA